MNDLENFNPQRNSQNPNINQDKNESLNGSESSEGIPQAAINKVEKDRKQAKQIRTSIKEGQKKDRKHADMLTIIFKIENNEIIKQAVRMINNDTDIKTVFKVFIPVLPSSISNNYESINDFINKHKDTINSIQDYGTYIKKNIIKNKEIQNISNDIFTVFIKEIIFHFDINNINQAKKTSKNPKEFEKKLLESLKKDLYN